MLWLALLGSACASTPPGSVDLGPLGVRLRECGILGPGAVGPNEILPFFAPDECYVECLAATSCASLVARACGTSAEAARACDEACAHHCDNGALVSAAAICDGVDECGDGSDERGCPSFRCDDTTTVAALARCNGYSECSDGSDERACSNVCTTTWGDRRVMQAYWHCNGYEECEDGSDEVGCTHFDCGGGQIVASAGRDVRCDGNRDCWSTGADEMGCPVRAPRVVMCAP